MSGPASSLSEASCRPIGCAVVGAGRAGRARIAAIEASPELALIGVVHRAPEAGQPSFDAVLESPEVDALVLCTPNALHFEQAERALQQNKHVLVEFPLAENRSQAAQLFELARGRGRVIHVGHIELIAPSQLELRARAAELGPPLSGEVRFTGGIEGWIGDDLLAGSPALRALARLHRLRDLFGAGQVVAAEVKRPAHGGYSLRVDLEFASGGRVRLIEERSEAAPRATHWAVECERGPLRNPSASSPRGVFAQDLESFASRIAAVRRVASEAPGSQLELTATAEDARLEALELEVLTWIERIDHLTEIG